MTFLSGFAQGFTDERKRRLDREADIEDTQFQYGMKALMEKKGLRDAKKAQEAEWSEQAKMAANQAGNPDAAGDFYKEIAVGKRSYADIQKDIADGRYVKNPDFKPPTQTIKVPDGVATKAQTAVNDDGIQLNPKVRERIAGIDPSLLEAETSSTMTPEAGGAVIFQPKNEYKVGDLTDVTFELNAAEQSGNPERIRVARDKMKASKEALQLKAKYDAEAKGQDAFSYAVVDAQGNQVDQSMGTYELDADGNKVLMNIAGAKSEPVKLGDTDRVVRLTEKQIEYRRELSEKYEKSSEDLKGAQAGFVGLLGSKKRIQDIVARNPTVTTVGATAASWLKQLQDEAGGIANFIGNEEEANQVQGMAAQQDQIMQLVKNNQMGDAGEQIKSLKDQLNNFKKNAMSSANTQLAYDKIDYEAARIESAFQYAYAMGMGGKTMSNQDFNRIYQMNGGEGKDATSVVRLLDDSAKTIYSKLKVLQDQQENNAAVKNFEKEIKFKTGLIPERMGNILERTNPELIPEFNRIYAAEMRGRENAVRDDVTPEIAKPDAPAVAVKSKAEFDKLPSGTKFIAPDGSERIKP